jgi:hypothetical protein
MRQYTDTNPQCAHVDPAEPERMCYTPSRKNMPYCTTHLREHPNPKPRWIPKAPTECSVEGCQRVSTTKGLCVRHYERLRLRGDVGFAEIVNHKDSLQKCSMPSCTTSFSSASSTLCRKHRNTAKKYSLPEDQLIRYYTSPCTVCGATDSHTIDHDHSCCNGNFSCGKCIRGILCGRCNVVLGHTQDSPDLLRKAADYLESTTDY